MLVVARSKGAEALFNLCLDCASTDRTRQLTLGSSIENATMLAQSTRIGPKLLTPSAQHRLEARQNAKRLRASRVAQLTKPSDASHQTRQQHAEDDDKLNWREQWWVPTLRLAATCAQASARGHQTEAVAPVVRA